MGGDGQVFWLNWSYKYIEEEKLKKLVSSPVKVGLSLIEVWNWPFWYEIDKPRNGNFCLFSAYCKMNIAIGSI